MQNDLRENVGLVRSALLTMEEASSVNPIIHGRMINITEQLKSLLISMNNHINL